MLLTSRVALQPMLGVDKEVSPRGSEDKHVWELMC